MPWPPGKVGVEATAAGCGLPCGSSAACGGGCWSGGVMPTCVPSGGTCGTQMTPRYVVQPNLVDFWQFWLK